MSFVWTPYKNSQGEWAEYQGLVLTAWHTGAWTVSDPSGKIKPRSSEMLIRHIVGGIEAGKKLAEEAAMEMTRTT
jgi:hypothetical protein